MVLGGSMRLRRARYGCEIQNYGKREMIVKITTATSNVIKYQSSSRAILTLILLKAYVILRRPGVAQLCPTPPVSVADIYII